MNKIWEKGLNGILTVFKDEHIEVKTDLASVFAGEILCQCGGGEPSRDYACAWVWENENNDEKVKIFISSTLNKETVLEKLTKIFDSVGNLKDFMNKYENATIKL